MSSIIFFFIELRIVEYLSVPIFIPQKKDIAP